MCNPLRIAALKLEQGAAEAHERNGDAASIANVGACIAQLKQEVANYHSFLISIGI